MLLLRLYSILYLVDMHSKNVACSYLTLYLISLVASFKRIIFESLCTQKRVSFHKLIQQRSYLER